MIVVHGVLTYLPEKEAEFLAKVKTLETLTNTEEEGCIHYIFTKDLDTPGMIHVFEEWTDSAALKAHLSAEHYLAFRNDLRGLRVRATVIDRYDVTAKRDLLA